MYVCLFYILFWRVPLNCKEKKTKNNIYCPVEEVRYLLWTATIWTTIWKTHLVDGSEWFHVKENVLWENIIPTRKVEPHNKPKMKVIVLRKNGFDLETKMFLNFWRYFFLFVLIIYCTLLIPPQFLNTVNITLEWYKHCKQDVNYKLGGSLVFEWCLSHPLTSFMCFRLRAP